MHILLIIAICVAAPLVPLSLLMKNYRLDTMEQHVKGRVIGGRVEQGREVQIVREEDGAAKKGLGRWLQWPMMKKRSL